MVYTQRAIAYAKRGVAYLVNNNKYEEAIGSFLLALQHGITDKEIKQLQLDTNILPEANKPIFDVFQSVAEIFNILKVDTKNTEPNKDITYLSHMTSFAVGAKLLNHTLKNKFRMYHIVYANDPTEGKVLFTKLGVSPKAETEDDEMFYVMVASFCGDKDIKELDTLPMWNIYGKNATGIALLFKASDIASKNKGQATPLSSLNDKMSGIFYGNKRQYRQSSSFINGHEIVLEMDDKPLENKEQTTRSFDNNAKANKEIPKPILYRVHYTDLNIPAGKKTNTTIDKKINGIKEALKQLEKEQDTYKKTLKLLDGVRYLVKGAKYQHENEYRLLYFANENDIPELLKYEVENSSDNKDNNSPNQFRIYRETEILENLYGVMTAPQVNDAQRLRIQYLLQWYKKEHHLNKPKKKHIYRSNIPYRS